MREARFSRDRGLPSPHAIGQAHAPRHAPRIRGGPQVRAPRKCPAAANVAPGTAGFQARTATGQAHAPRPAPRTCGGLKVRAPGNVRQQRMWSPGPRASKPARRGGSVWNARSSSVPQASCLWGVSKSRAGRSWYTPPLGAGSRAMRHASAADHKSALQGNAPQQRTWPPGPRASKPAPPLGKRMRRVLRPAPAAD